jgi:predicted TIM-barrel fold metal-dependent hydrolase
VIIDFHTHIFPPGVRAERDEYLRRDRTFAEMYSNPHARIATAEDLLASMEEAGVDVSVALGYAWMEEELIARHNDYLLESAARSDGRIIPFCTINMAAKGAEKEIGRVAAGGAQGLGELRPGNQGWDLNGPPGETLAAAARRWGLVLVHHVTEPVGHLYPGKQGGSLSDFYWFAVNHPDLHLVGAHLAGGLPFYAHMPRVAEVLERVYVDTAAQSFLYRPDVYSSLIQHIAAGRVLVGSDFPLVSPAEHLAEIRDAVPGADSQRLILGANAARLLGLVRA